MTAGRDPWADPATPTEPGQPYAGPPATAPPTAPPYGYPSPYGHPAPYGYPGGYGPPAPYGYPLPPRPPSRPGQVVTSAVLAFVQAGLVVLSSIYLWFFASVADLAAGPSEDVATVRGLATEATVLAVVQLLSVVLLVVAGIAALNRRTQAAWLLLVAGHGVQILLSLYWLVRILDLLGDVPGPTPEGAFAAFTIFFAAGPLVGLGMVVAGPGRRWFSGDAQA